MPQKTRAEIDGLDGPGVYGGPADEKIASPLEREALRKAGFAETKLKTLWFGPPSTGDRAFSVDEALDEVSRMAAV